MKNYGYRYPEVRAANSRYWPTKVIWSWCAHSQLAFGVREKRTPSWIKSQEKQQELTKHLSFCIEIYHCLCFKVA